MGKLDKVNKLIEKGNEKGLLKLAGDKDKEVKLAAIGGLGKVGKDDSFNVMITFLIDPDADIRAAAAAALGTMGNNHANAHLRYHLNNEKDPKVIEAMKVAISSLREE